MCTASVLIAEDELSSSVTLEQILTQHPSVQLTGIARNGRTAVTLTRNLLPDILILDAEIPELDWSEVAATTAFGDSPIVILVSRYQQCSCRREIRALDWLVKPLDEDRLRLTLNKALQRLEASGKNQSAHPAPTSSQAREAGRLSLKHGGTTVFLEIDRIDYLEAAGNYVHVCAGRQRYTVRETLGSFEARLRTHDFVRIHRSVIVNRRRIRALKPWPTGEYIVTLVSGKELTLSRGFRDRLPLLRIA